MPYHNHHKEKQAHGLISGRNLTAAAGCGKATFAEGVPERSIKATSRLSKVLIEIRYL
jgi:hypothetical protein